MYRFRLFVWQLFWPPDKVRLKKQRWVSKKLERLVRGGTGGAMPAMTLKEALKVWGLLMVLIIAAAILSFAMIFTSVQPQP